MQKYTHFVNFDREYFTKDVINTSAGVFQTFRRGKFKWFFFA